MCQQLYIASHHKLSTVRRTKGHPYLQVDEVANEAWARALFRDDLANLYAAGAHAECGCGFPFEPVEPITKRGRPDDADLASLIALANHIRDACRKRSVVQLYLCWSHEVSE